MYVNNCLDQDLTNFHLKDLSATTVEEQQFLKACARLLYKTKSSLKSTKIIDQIVNANPHEIYNMAKQD